MTNKEIKTLINKLFFYTIGTDNRKERLIYFYEEAYEKIKNENYYDKEVYTYLTDRIRIESNYDNGGFKDNDKENLITQLKYIREMFIDDLTRFRVSGLSPYERIFGDYPDISSMEFRKLEAALYNRERLTNNLLKSLDSIEAKSLIKYTKIFFQDLLPIIINEKSKRIAEEYIDSFNKRFKINRTVRKTKSNELTFPEYLDLKNAEDFADKLKVEFKGSIGKDIAMMIYCIKDYLKQTPFTKKDFYNSIRNFFDESIGKDSGINRYLDANYNHKYYNNEFKDPQTKIEISAVQTRIKKILNSKIKQ